jgi:hypothetical protein
MPTKSTLEDGTVEYRNKHGELHRRNAPAIVHPDGTEYWFLNGLPHRADGSKYWYLNNIKQPASTTTRKDSN